MKENNNNLFPIQVFPEKYKDYIYYGNDLSNYDLNFKSLGYLVATASLLNIKTTIEAQDHCQRAIIWGGAIQWSGKGKSAMLKTTNSYLLKIQEKHSLKCQEEKTEAIQYLSTDITPEAIGLNHLNNSKGFLLDFDELSAWIKGFDKYNNGKGNEKQTYLKLWNGDHLNISRKGKSFDTGRNLYIPNTKVNIFGTIQPDLAHLIVNKQDIINGFTQRFLICRPYFTGALLKDITKKKDYVLQTAIKERQKLLWELPETKYILNEEALNLWGDIWSNEKTLLYHEQEDKINESIQGKLDLYCLRIALILFTLHQVEGNTEIKKDSNGKTIIPAEFIASAIKVCEWARKEFNAILYKENVKQKLKGMKPDFVDFYAKLDNTGIKHGELKKLFNNTSYSPANFQHIINAEKGLFIKQGNKYFKTYQNGTI